MDGRMCIRAIYVSSYLEPLLGRAPVAGGEDDGVEGAPLAIGELHEVPVHASHLRQHLQGRLQFTYEIVSNMHMHLI